MPTPETKQTVSGIPPRGLQWINTPLTRAAVEERLAAWRWAEDVMAHRIERVAKESPLQLEALKLHTSETDSGSAGPTSAVIGAVPPLTLLKVSTVFWGVFWANLAAGAVLGLVYVIIVAINH